MKGDQQQINDDDDYQGVAKFAATRLQQLGFSATVSSEPRGALNAFNSALERFDAIVTDLTMPDPSGLESIKHIRARSERACRNRYRIRQ